MQLMCMYLHVRAYYACIPVPACAAVVFVMLVSDNLS
jgi:hypothetical protein